MVIMVIISIIIGSILTLSYFNHIYRNRFEIEDQLRSNVNSGINLIMSDKNFIGYGEEKTLSLFQEEFDSIIVQKESWGLFDLLYCRSTWRNIIQEKIVLADAYYKKQDLPALYLADLNKPLCVSGKTYIEGDCLLPKAGIKNGYVEGRHYERRKLLEGSVEFSTNELPANQPKLENNYFEFVKEKYLNSTGTHIGNYSDFLDNTIANSFYKPTLVFYQDTNLILSKTLLGNIIIINESDIIIRNTAQVEDAIIYAKNIFIEDGFEGTLQCIASRSIITGNACKFNYPSNLALITSKINNKGTIKLGSGSKIEGAIVAYTNWTHKNNQSQVLIQKETQITGELYSNGQIELQGNVYGSIFCNEFILRKPSAIYINHLLDVEINVSSLPEDYTGTNLINCDHPSKIIKPLI